jgi:hypothetical protein
MDVIEIAGRLYEFTELAPGTGDGFVVECFDLSDVGGGLVGSIETVPGGGGEVRLEHPVPLRVLRYWLVLVDRDRREP